VSLQQNQKRGSFAAGEISPTLFARDDLARWQIGLARLENMAVLLEGGLTRVPGTRFVQALKDESRPGRLLRFRYTAADNYVIVINGGVMRLVKDGGVVLDGADPFELSLPWSDGELDGLHAQQQESQVFLVGDGREPQQLTRSGPLAWTIDPYRPAGGPVDRQNLNRAVTITASGTTGSVTLTGDGTAFSVGDIGGVLRLDEPDLTKVASWTANEVLTSADAVTTGGTPFGDMTKYGGIAAAFNGVLSQPATAAAGSNSVPHGYVGLHFTSSPVTVNRVMVYGTNNYGFAYNGNPTDGTFTLRLYGKRGSAPANGTDGVVLGSTKVIRTLNESGGRAVYSNDTVTAWNYLWVEIEFVGPAGSDLLIAELQFYHWSGGQSTNLRRYNGRVYVALNDGDTGANPPTHEEGDVLSGQFNVAWRFLHNGYGLVRITAVTDAQHLSGEVISVLPDSVVTSPTFRWWPPGWSPGAGWPNRVHAHDQSLLFARGNTWWMTRPSDQHSLEVLPQATEANADSALAVRLTAYKNNLPVIEWMQSATVILLGLADGERVVRMPGQFDALTADKLRTVPQTSEGAAQNHDPVDADDGLVMIGRSRRRLHFIRYDSLAEGVEPDEITISNRRILNGLAKRLAWQRDPDRILWVMCADGSLAGSTFMPAQQVNGFFRAPLQGGAPVVEDMASNTAADGTVDQMYFLVRRTIDGATRRYVEQLQPWFEAPDDGDASAAWYADCGLRYEGAPVSTVSGLDHLEGETVRVFADGAQQTDKTVSGGAIALDAPAASVLVGLPKRGYVRSLPIEFETQQGTTKGKIKAATHVVLDLVESMGGRVRANGGPWSEIFNTGDLDYGTPPALFTGTKRIAVDCPSDETLVIEIEIDTAWPFTLAGWTVEITLEPR